MAKETVAITQLGQEKSDFPLLRLPPEIRNQIYRETLCEGGFIVQLLPDPEPGLLRTNKQIRNEALPIYYGENHFLVSIHAPKGLIRISPAVRFFVNDVTTSIKAHIRHITIHIHDQLNDRTGHYDHFMEFIDGSHRPNFGVYSVGEPSADWTNYISARNDFFSALVDMPGVPVDSLPLLEAGHHVYSERYQPAHSLFEAAWLLARTFTAATKSVYINCCKR